MFIRARAYPFLGALLSIACFFLLMSWQDAGAATTTYRTTTHRSAASHRRRPASERGHSAAASRKVNTKAAPRLTRSGQTLSWSHIGNVSTYVLVDKVPGQAYQFKVVNGTSSTPSPVLGESVLYSVRTDVEGSAWATPVTISFPAAKPASTSITEAPTPAPITEAPAPSPPITEAPASTPPIAEKPASGTGSDPETPSSGSGSTGTPSAPVLSVHGDTLSWLALSGESSYTLATVKNPTTTRETTYSTVTGTSFTPPAVPGQTVAYGLAAHAPAAGPWAQEVAITYPQGSPILAEEPVTKPTEEPAKPVEEPAKPTEEPAKPVEEPAKPTEEPAKPVEEPAKTKEEPASSSETFGLPFVKGITANFEGEGPNNVPEEVTEMHSLGVNWTREALDWSEMEPQKGVYDWASFDQVVAEAKASNISILPIVGYAPSWTSPTNAAAYAEFVAAAVARYGPGTNANLQWWELWNEPYFAYAWSGHTPEPEAYGRDALAAAEAAKKIAPTVKLLIAADYQEAEQTGGTSPTEQTWINDMFTAAPTLGKWIDGVSVHPYGGDPSTPLAQVGGYLDTSGQWGFQRIDTIREKFLAHGVNVPFWITEEGWSTWENSEATIAHNYADLITQIKTRPWIRALFPFGMREDDAHPTNNQPGFGLLKYGTREPKAAWTILQEGFKTLN